MDCISHALVGIMLYQTRRDTGTRPADPFLWAAVIGSEMPDADILYYLDGSMTYILNHRGITHSLPGLVFMAALLAYLLHRRYPATSMRRLFRWSSSAGLVHILLDALNTWGTRIWLPFSGSWVTWDLLPFTDPLLIFLCVMGLAAGVRHAQKRRCYALAVCLLFMVYVGGRAVIHWHFVQELQLQYASVSLRKVSVLPTTHPLHWQAVLETSSSVVLGDINNSTMHVECTAWYPVCEDPLLTIYRTNESVAPSLPFFRYPALSLTQEADKNIIVVSDLYFYANPERRASFELRKDGTITRPKRKKMLPAP